MLVSREGCKRAQHPVSLVQPSALAREMYIQDRNALVAWRVEAHVKHGVIRVGVFCLRDQSWVIPREGWSAFRVARNRFRFRPLARRVKRC